jgi:ligand-binding sensor domain-containing protein
MIFPRVIGTFISLCILSIAPASLFAQADFQWTVYSALNSAQSAAFDEDDILWVATTGGVVGYDSRDDSFSVYHTRDDIYPEKQGLLSLNSTAIAFDPATGDMYVGSNDGLVSIRRKSGGWGYSAEISAMAERPSRTIRGFGFRNGRVYMLTSFGIGVYNPIDSSFIESYFRFGSIPQNTPVNAIAFWNDRIWVGTEKGLAHAPANATNLAAPSSWEIYPLTGAGRIISLASLSDRLLVGSDSGAHTITTGGFEKRSDLPNAPVRLAANGEHVVASTEGTLFRYEGSGFQEISGSPDKITALAVSPNGVPGVGFERRGMGMIDNGVLVAKEPNSPAANLFSDLALAGDGALWSASAERTTPGGGVSRLKDEHWTVFNMNNNPLFGTNNVWAVGTGRESSIWAGTYGKGVVVITPVDNGFQAEHFNETNSPARGILSSPSFVIIGKSVTDANGRTWSVNYDPTSSNGSVLLARLRPGEESRDGSGFEGYQDPYNLARNYKDIVIDENGTKWLIAGEAEGPQRGLIGMNDRGTPTDETDDNWVNLPAENGLLSNTQLAIVVDRLGEIWLGLPVGLQVLVNPSSVVNNDANPVFRTIRPLSDILVHAIAVDALNRKWVGTDQGVFLLSAEGDSVIERFTTDNSPLVNNQIRSILSVDATGDIYIGTTNGMNRVSTSAVEPPEGETSLTVSPHPFVIPSAEPLRIKGLPANATVKIFGAGLTLVREFQSPGGAVAFWDGLDNSGETVPSGIYIVAASSNSGDEAILGKVAVIRR